MTAPRSRKEAITYTKHLKQTDNSVCPFCHIDPKDEQYVDETRYFFVIKNTFPYSIWDGQEVKDHLMVTPKVHTDSLGTMTQTARLEYVDILEKYEKQGYNIYARAPTSIIKTIVHQHTHLIKTAGKPRRVLFMLRKPYIRFSM
jgi:diadenosine tetraphosphate (Ap4A) HIT family hydrolase